MPQLDVMTCNVRQMDGEDGEQSWEHRKHVLVETIALHLPAIVGTQETWDGQTQYILERLPSYRAFGQGRFGDARDKHNKVFYDAEKLKLLESGEIWISTTPEIAGSSSWGIPSPRMITWGRLRMSEHAFELMLLNTHFPYGRGADEARRQTARLIREKIAGLPAGLPIVITGDFNARAGGEIHETLKRDLVDAWETAETQRGPVGTVHGFGKFNEGGRIDWILHRHAERVLWAETVTHTADGLFPSDHYPVVARLGFAPDSAADE